MEVGILIFCVVGLIVTSFFNTKLGDTVSDEIFGLMGIDLNDYPDE